jgi:hypothetical protein
LFGQREILRWLVRVAQGRKLSGALVHCKSR